jgi:methyl-accepting chemotaxis protein
MKERRRFGQIKLALQVIRAALIVTTILILTSFVTLVWIVTINPPSVFWKVSMVLIHVCFGGAVITMLLAISGFVRNAVRPIARVEGILDKVIAGDYTQRITFREKDYIRSFIEKVNAVIALVEKNRKR